MTPALPDGYAVRALTAADAEPLAQAYARNREHLAPWDPIRDATFFTPAGQAALITTQLAGVAAGRLDAHVITWGDQVVGRVNLNHLVRGALQSASVGYWTDHAHLRRGLATAAVGHAVRRATELGLHRLDAGTLLHNAASQRVLLGCGFTEYGLARKYLFIAGSWQDHRLFERLLHDDPPRTDR